MIRCKIEQDFMSRNLKVWLAMDTAHGADVWYPSGEMHQIKEGELIIPSLLIPQPMMEALLREAQNFIPATDATTAHLKDAIEVRDRLLTMVEKRK